MGGGFATCSSSGFGLWSLEFGVFMLASDRRVFPNAPPPRKARDTVRHYHPSELDKQPAEQIGSDRFAHVDAHWKIKLIRKRGEIERLLDSPRQNVQREQMAAGDVFERKQNEDERGDFQHPKGQHCHRIRHEELEQRRQERRKKKKGQRSPVRRQHEISAEIKNEQRQRYRCHGQV